LIKVFLKFWILKILSKLKSEILNKSPKITFVNHFLIKKDSKLKKCNLMNSGILIMFLNSLLLKVFYFRKDNEIKVGLFLKSDLSGNILFLKKFNSIFCFLSHFGSLMPIF
jgi:hypothetical protein